jgi:ribosomal protein S1
VPGTIREVEPGYARLDIAPGVEGFLPAGEITHVRTEDARDTLWEGQPVTVEILRYEINSKNRNAVVSLKALLPEPYAEFKDQHRVGERVEATVERSNDQHVNVRLPNGAPGHLHASQISYDRVDDASRHYKPGHRFTAQITEFNDKKRQVELSVKAMLPDPFTAFMDSHSVGQTVIGVVTKLFPKSASVRLNGGVRGSIFIRHVTGYPLASFEGHLRLNERYDFRIVGYDLERKQVNLARFGLAPSDSYSAPRLTTQPPVQTVRQSAPQPRRMPPPVPLRTPRSMTAEGASVEEATASACRALGLQTALVQVEVFDRGERSFLGRVKRLARVRVTERI